MYISSFEGKKTNAVGIAFLIFFCLMCIGAIFFTSDLFVDSRLSPKWYSTKILFCIFLIFCFSRLFCFKGNSARWGGITGVFVLISVFSFVLALRGLFQFFYIQPHFNGNNMVGWYDTSAGFATSLCAALPFSFLLKKEIIPKYLAALFITVISLAIVFSFSRAGIFSLSIVSIIYLFQRYLPKRRIWLIFIGIIISLVLIVGLYFMKQKSADGRILIWKCSFSMIADRPLFGFGSNGFHANYMNYQAEYFKTHIDSKYTMIADSINHPYNEYILLIVRYGIAGFLCLLAILLFVWKSYFRNPRNDSFIAGLCLISIAVFSLFSYPFSYPFIWILCGVSIYIIITNARYSFLIPGPYVRLASLVIIVFSIYTGWGITEKITREMEWSKISRKAMRNIYTEVVQQYGVLYPSLQDNPQFLYNYAAVLNYNKDYTRSLSITNRGMSLFSNYDLQMLAGDNLFRLGQYLMAEHCYMVASNMCPSRFFPLYQLSRVYEVTGNTNKLIDISKEIINKPVKVESVEILMMKHEMKLKYEELRLLIKNKNTKLINHRQNRV